MAADLWEMQENQYVSEILIDKREFVVTLFFLAILHFFSNRRSSP